MTNNELGLKLIYIIKELDETMDVSSTYEKIDSLVVSLYSDDNTEAAEKLKRELFFN